MKKTIIGIAFLLTGTTFLLPVLHHAYENYGTGSWSVPPGKFISCLQDFGGVLQFTVGAIVFLLGFILLLREAFPRREKPALADAPVNEQADDT